MCSKKTVKFLHTRGTQNPADATTRPYSHNVLKKNKLPFLQGPKRINLEEDCFFITDRVITLPNPGVLPVDEVQGSWACNAEQLAIETKEQRCRSEWRAIVDKVKLPVDLGKCMEFFKCINHLKYVLLFLNKLKIKVCGKALSCVNQNSSLNRQAKMMIIRNDQKCYFQTELDFLSSKRPVRDLPPLIAKMNLFVDEDGLLKVKSKMGKFGNVGTRIIMHRKSIVTEAIIRQVHEMWNHCGAHQIVNMCKNEFLVSGIFSLVKKILQECIVCRRFNARPIKLSQSDYRIERVSPEKQPFANIYIDYAGPFLVTLNDNKIKVWLLILTCMWTRAVNILVCRSADAADFVKALQAHIYSYGVFKSCTSDLGSQIRAGANALQSYLCDLDTQDFLDFHNIKWMQFKQFAKGNSALGSLVEVCVKQVKLLINKTIKKAMLDYFQFEQLILKIKSLINKRPIAFKSELSSLKLSEIPEPITPEMLVRGYETSMLDIVSSEETLHVDSDDDSDDFSPGVESVCKLYKNLRAAKGRLLDAYHHEFLNNLISQAVDKKDRYKPVKHEHLKVGDIVLLVEPNVKRLSYPMGKIERVERNELGEATAAYVFKGKTRESVYRHVTSLILLLSREEEQIDDSELEIQEQILSVPCSDGRTPRQAAVHCREKLKSYFQQ